MRFFQRFASRSRPSVRTLFAEGPNVSGAYEAMPWLMQYNFNPLQKCQSYVPKCLSATSPSDYLIGADLEEAEDFSTGCWLQDHLHQFGNGISQLVAPNGTGTLDNDNDDSIDSQTCSGSDVSTEADENDDYLTEDTDVNDYEYLPLLRLFQPASISGYTMVQEPPPYGFDEPPPSYEEATQGFADQISLSSSNSSTDFVLY